MRSKLMGFGLWLVLQPGLLHAEEFRIPVPIATIYPRDLITQDMLTDRAMNLSSSSAAAIVTARFSLVGKVARQTLLAGSPVLASAVEAQKLVSNGSQVKIVFQNDGISIFAFGQAMQNGVVGEIIRVRNLDSGITISGTVQADGSVRVGET